METASDNDYLTMWLGALDTRLLVNEGAKNIVQNQSHESWDRQKMAVGGGTLCETATQSLEDRYLCKMWLAFWSYGLHNRHTVLA